MGTTRATCSSTLKGVQCAKVDVDCHKLGTVLLVRIKLTALAISHRVMAIFSQEFPSQFEKKYSNYVIICPIEVRYNTVDKLRETYLPKSPECV